ncbi:MAG: M56 family metallopeptidase [Chlamydiota bacterium]
MDKFALFIFNIFINSFLVFFTTALLVEGLIVLFRIRQGRCAAWLRMIPLCKLSFDLFLYDFSRWAYTSGLDLFRCEEGARAISIGSGVKYFSTMWAYIEMTIEGSKTITLADIVSAKIPIHILFWFSVSLCFLSSVFLYKQVRKLYGVKSSFKGYALLMENPTLSLYCERHHIQVLITNELISSPCIVGIRRPTIYIPAAYALSLKECEAIVAHEVEHFRYKDTLLRWILQCIRAGFWWVPTNWLQKRIEEGQESSCDQGCFKHGIDPVDLASAIHTAANYFWCW